MGIRFTTASEIRTALLQVMSFVTMVPPFEPAWAGATDAEGLPIWSAAVRSGTQFVISHNLRDFPPRNSDGVCAYAGVEFITTANFVTDILGLDLGTVAPLPPRSGIAHQRRK